MDFLEAVDAAVDEALPPEWPRVAPERLGRETPGVARVRHAFMLGSAEGGESAEPGAGPGRPGRYGGPGRSGEPGASGGGEQRDGDGTAEGSGGASRRRAPYLGIVALARQAVALPETQAARELTALRDQALARGGHLLLLYEQEGLDCAGELGGFIATRLDLPHPRWLALGCARDAGGVWSAEPTPSGREPLAEILRDLWCGELRFSGPRAGRQTVGVELMRDACWCCEQPIATVTGLVFPDRPVVDWSSPDWRYFRRLLPLAEIEPRTLAALAAQVEQWLRTEARAERITPLGVRSSLRPRPAGRRSSWAALCPDCGALRGAFLVGADRLDLLLDGESRRTGRLCYRPWEIEVGYDLLKALAAGTELSLYACPFGWRRQRAREDAGAPRLAGMVSGAPAERSSAATAGRVPPAPAPELLAALAAEAERLAEEGRPARSERVGAEGEERVVRGAGPGAVIAGAPARSVPRAAGEAAPQAPAAGLRHAPTRAPERLPRLWQALASARAWAAAKRARHRAGA